jgi:sigma-B regulation protein RsbU (phosphoserine phosphatase)
LSGALPSISRWWLYQLFYATILLTAFGVLWAVGQQLDISSGLLFAFGLGNLNTIAIDLLRLRLSREKPVIAWALFTGAEIVVIPLFFLTIVAIGIPLLGPQHMNGPLWHYVATGWKMPLLMTFVFGVAYNFYRQASERLERRNRELEHAVKREVAGRELQEQDLERAREIQQALLPKEIAQVPGFEVVAAWEPARLVGGDYYDVIRLSGTKLGICIADVVGKGVSAALLMANVQATVRAYASEQAAPSWLCRRVNEVLCNNLADDKFVTLFYGILDAEDRTLRYTTAGHLPPLLVCRDGTHETLCEGGAVLGVFPDWQYQEGLIELSPGDRICLFTDGITEATSANGEEFGEMGVLQVAIRESASSADELRDRLLSEVKQFCHSQFHDDATLLLIAAQGVSGDRDTSMQSSTVAAAVSSAVRE